MPVAQNGWPASAVKADIHVDPNFNVAGVKFPGGVKSGDVSTVLHYVAAQFHARVEKLRDGWCWGWAYRDVRGSSGLSNHAAACAIDVNAPNHALGAVGTFNAAQVRTIHAILGEVGGVVRWGGDYVGRKDEMHFEVVGSAAAVAAVAARLRGGGTTTTPAPPATGSGLLQRGSTGDRVKSLQRVLNAWYPTLRLVVDGDFGPATEKAVRDMQSRAGLVVDGIAGPATLGRLGLA
jgi:hypothetical protein